MSSDHSSRLGYVMLLALLVLWPVMIFVRQRRQSLVYQPMSDEDFVLAVVGIVGTSTKPSTASTRQAADLERRWASM